MLATLLDGVRSTGNHNVHVRMNPTPKSKRLIPFSALPEEEVNAILKPIVGTPFILFIWSIWNDFFELKTLWSSFGNWLGLIFILMHISSADDLLKIENSLPENYFSMLLRHFIKWFNCCWRHCACIRQKRSICLPFLETKKTI